jgi:hypothetical protein
MFTAYVGGLARNHICSASNTRSQPLGAQTVSNFVDPRPGEHFLRRPHV